MSAAAPPRSPFPAQPAAGFWRRRLLQPILHQLTRGVTPDKVAATLAVGTICSLFPFLGFTSLLNLAAGLVLRMNQPLLQVLNQLLGPVQLVLILVYVRAGELIWGQATGGFTVSEMIRQFHELSLGQFLVHFGQAGLHALSAWLLTSPVLAAVIYFAVRPLLRRSAVRVSA